MSYFEFLHAAAGRGAVGEYLGHVARLRQATGAASPRDLEPMLQAFGQLELVQQAPAAIEFEAGVLRLKGVPLPATALEPANQRLRPLGLRLHGEGDTVVLRQEEGA